MNSDDSLIPAERIENSIHQIRGLRVMLDADLAALYEVETRTLVQAVKRNIKRFPEDLVFQLTREEFQHVIRQSGTSNTWGGRRYPPYAFTEQGVAMISSVLRNPRAVQVNIELIRTSVRFRHLLASNAELVHKFEELEKKTDERFKIVFDAIRQLMTPPAPRQRQIGIRQKQEGEA